MKPNLTYTPRTAPVTFRGGQYAVRESTLADTMAIGADPDPARRYASIVVRSLVDKDTGAPIFEPHDVPALTGLPIRELQPVVDAVTSLNGSEDTRPNA